jgi:membrane fusion protein, multidrug efflux system
MRYRVLSCLAALCLLPLTGCKRNGAADADDAGAEVSSASAVVGAQTGFATRQPFTETVDAIGVVVPRPGHVADLSAPAPTRVTQLFVAIGERVAIGAPLVEFDRAPFDAQARSADVALTTAEHGFERAQKLSAAGIMARKDADQAASDLAAAQAAAVSAHRAQSFATLHAPIAGVVTKLSAVLGAPADVSQAVVEVADPSALDLVFTVSPGDAARMRAHQPAHIMAGQHETGEPLGTATVAAVAATVDTASRGVSVRAQLLRPARPLRIGETVFGRVAVAVHPNAVTVPVAALVPEGEGVKVFVVDSVNRAHAVLVTVGGRTDQLAEITSGLSGGEKIVTVGAYGVDDSVKVVPMGSPEAMGAGDNSTADTAKDARP